MNLFDHSDIDWADVLAPWQWLLPPELTGWLINLFGGLFVVLDEGEANMFDGGCGALERVAESREATRLITAPAWPSMKVL